MADFRRWILAFATLVLILGCAVPASAQHSIVCNASAVVTPTLRHEGFRELVGDILLTCIPAPGPSGAPTPPGQAIPQANVSVTFGNITVTPRLLGTSNGQTLTDALLLVDDPTPTNQDVCTAPTNPASACIVYGDGGLTFNNPDKFNVFQGVLGGGPGPNSVTFQGIPVDPPVTSRTYRITNLRVDATNVFASAFGFSVGAFVSSSSSTSIQITNPSVIVGIATNGLAPSLSTLNQAFLQCQNSVSAPVGSVVFTENFATAFKVAGVTGANTPQNIPGTVYYSESGLEIPVGPAGSTTLTGVADTPTELYATISNIPTGASVYVQAYAVSSAAVTCESPCVSILSDANMVLPSAYTGNDSSVMTLVNPNGETSVTVVWAISHTNSSAIDTLKFAVSASFAGQTTNPIGNIPPTTLSAIGFYPLAAAFVPGGPIPQFSSTINPQPTSPQTLFTVTQCQTILLFPYVTDVFGFDTGMAISNTSWDNLPAVATALKQTGSCKVDFWANGAVATNFGTNVTSGYTAIPGEVDSTIGYGGDLPINSTATNPGFIEAGQTWSFLLGRMTDATYETSSTPATPGYGVSGYAIAICNFQYAHGYTFVSDDGIRNFATAYLALVIPDAIRNPQPFTCSQSGGSTCAGQSGEQLVH